MKLVDAAARSIRHDDDVVCEYDDHSRRSRAPLLLLSLLLLFDFFSVGEPIKEMRCDCDGLACGLCGVALDAEGLANGLEDGAGGDLVVIGCSSSSGGGGGSCSSSSSSMVQDGGRVGATHVDEGEGGEIARLGLSG